MNFAETLSQLAVFLGEIKIARLTQELFRQL